MLLQLLTRHPEALGSILKNTPPWVGGLLVALVALGLSQLRDRQPQLAQEPRFAVTVALLYGVFNGLFAGRALRLARLFWRQGAPALVAGA